MIRYRVQPDALAAIEGIHRYSIAHWGEARADAYLLGFFDLFERIATHSICWQPIPASFDVAGYRCRYQRHLVYWRTAIDGTVIIFAVLHEKMHQMDRIRRLDLNDDRSISES